MGVEEKTDLIEISSEMESIGAYVVHEGTVLECGNYWIAEEVFRQMLAQAVKENKVAIIDRNALDEGVPTGPSR